MRREPLVIPETQQIAKLFDQMRSSRAHMALVIDEYGTFVGIVTLEDLLEEIVGEIHDETDEKDELVDVVMLAEGQWEAEGLVSLNDLGKTVGLAVPVDLEANTLSGLFMHRLARIPKVGDELIESGFNLLVLVVEDHRAGRVRITRLSEASGMPAEAEPDDSASEAEKD